MATVKFSQLPGLGNAIPGTTIIPVVTGGTNYSVTVANLLANASGTNYSNANVAAYLPTDSTIIGINSNVANTNSNVTTVTNNLANTNSNVANLTTSLSNTNSNVANTNSNVTTITNSLANTNSNVANTNANVTTVSNNLANTNSNVTTVTNNLANTNSNVANTNANVTAVSNAIANTNSNVTAVQGNVTTLQGNVVTLTTAVASLTGNVYGNANVAVYLPTDGTITTINSNVANTNSNVANLATSLTGTNSNVANTNANVANTNSNVANTNANVTTVTNNLANTNSNVANTNSNVTTLTTQVASLSGNVYANANVAAYLPTYTGNISLGNATATGNIAAQFFIGNGALLTGISGGGSNYSNANVAAYLPTYTGNIRLGNATATGNIAGQYFIGNGALLTGVTSTAGPSIANGSASLSLLADGQMILNDGTIDNNIDLRYQKVVIGTQATAPGSSESISIGWLAQSQQQSVAIGSHSYANKGVAVGSYTTGQSNTVAVGWYSQANINSTVLGHQTSRFGSGANNTTLGYQTLFSGISASDSSANWVSFQDTISLQGTTSGTWEAGMIVTKLNDPTYVLGTIQSIDGSTLTLTSIIEKEDGSGAIGGFFPANNNILALGYQAGFSNQGNNSIVLNSTGEALSQSTANTFTVKPVRSATGSQAMYYDPTTGEITFAPSSTVNITNSTSSMSIASNGIVTVAPNGGSLWGNSQINLLERRVAIGQNAGQISNINIVLGTVENSVAIGTNAGQLFQGIQSVAIGSNAGKSGSQSVEAYGTWDTVNPTYDITVSEYYEPNPETTFSEGMAIVWTNDQGTGIAGVIQSISGAVLTLSTPVNIPSPGLGGFTFVTGYETGSDYSVAVGADAGQFSQKNSAVAVGWQSGYSAQGLNAVAVGAQAGYDRQKNNAIAIGSFSATTNQGNNSIAIGLQAARYNQGSNSIAIGSSAGLNAQANNSIILNATNSALNQTTANTFTVKPVRQGGTGGSLPSGFFNMAYNPTTGEIIYWS